ncbi:MAG: hypothetical protein EBS19_12625 [Spirochaetia bacterium]|nr:hypothetical protein [Spirochaetia bacterium]
MIQNGSKDVSKNWRSLTYAAYISAQKLKNSDLLLQSATPLINYKSDDIPLWARTIGIFYLKKLSDSGNSDEICASLKFLHEIDKNILQDKNKVKKITRDNIFTTIIIERLNKIKANLGDASKCK